MAPLIFVLLLLVLIVFPLWAIITILALRRQNEQLDQRVAELQREFNAHRLAQRPPPASTPAAAALLPSTAPPPVVPEPIRAPVAPAPPVIPAAQTPVRTIPVPAEPVLANRQAEPPFESRPAPDLPPPVIAPPLRTVKARVNWEQFTGTKLLAWTGGFAAFLGAAFFIKYSFEHDLIPPAVRVAIGYLFALALVVVGLRIPRPRYAPTAQTLCATGIVCLYAVTFACSSIYDFAAFTPFRTFVLMALITASAFFLAVRLGAQVVAILGMLGGFLTPVLLSTGRDNAAALFGYVALLDVGLVALALHQRWLFLVPLGAAGTVAMQVGWAARFLTPAKAPTAMLICLVFCAIFVAADLAGRRLHRASSHLLWPAIALPATAFVFGLGFIGYPTIAAQPGLLFGFLFAADACLLALSWLDDDATQVHLGGGFALFLLLAIWTGLRLTDALLPWALGLYLAHGVVHTTYPLLLARRRPAAAASGWSQLFPALALVLMLVPLLKLDTVSFALWPFVLLVDVLAIALAAFSGSLIAVSLALVLTLVATALWIFRLPANLPAEPSLLLVIAGFAALFFGSSVFLARRLPTAGNSTSLRDPRNQLPVFSALMPFVLLVLMTQRLPVANPSGVFGVALLLCVLVLGLTRALGVAWLPLCALAGVAAVEYAWEARHATQAFSTGPFLWHVAFYALFTAFPFLWRTRFATTTGPWAVAALAGVVQFPLVHRLALRTWPDGNLGIVPALFAIAPLVSALVIARAARVDERSRMNQLAWLGGVALFFITLVIPIQFERQWITLGWALEGVALLWLFRRVPHPGLRGTGVVLLVAAFVRLALNPAVLGYHARAAQPIFNWYLYTYGIVTAALFAAAALLRPADERAFGVRAAPVLTSLGTVLAFLLLNIEIADFFSAPGTRVLTFQFSGNFARDMTYTIAWALFAFGLLLASIWKRARAGRYAALGLLGATVLKLFVHDLERLGALHRIGALFAVAIIAIAASLAYQRFLPTEEPSSGKKE